MKKPAFLVLVLVLGTVVLGLASAWILKEAALHDVMSMGVLVVVVLLVAAVNASRFVLWGYIHTHYPISLSYPLSSIFFPLILVMDYMYGETVTTNNLMGALLVTLGVGIIAYEHKGEP